jgi:hypothetical protein
MIILTRKLRSEENRRAIELLDERRKRRDRPRGVSAAQARYSREVTFARLPLTLVGSQGVDAVHGRGVGEFARPLCNRADDAFDPPDPARKPVSAAFNAPREFVVSAVAQRLTNQLC